MLVAAIEGRVKRLEMFEAGAVALGQHSLVVSLTGASPRIFGSLLG